jgi:peptidoglycan/xylan/chitin deacetylase (PgdA/CDA1 family)
VRGHLSPAERRLVRRTVDALAAPAVGSIRGVRAPGSKVAITFDDGPDADVTPRLLDVLAAEDVRATFFLLVNRAEIRPDLVRRIVAAGHEVGLHGWDHQRLTARPAAVLTRHLDEARARLEAIAGQPVRFLRPPFGAQNLRTYVAARRAGLEVVVWSADAMDWVDQRVDEVAARAAAQVEPGGILLLHEVLEADGVRPSPVTSFDRAEAARAVITALRQRGRDVTSVGELLAGGKPRRTAWFRP